LIRLNAEQAGIGHQGRERRGDFMTITEKLTQPVGGWTAWCVSARGIPLETRNPVPRKPRPEKNATQESLHAE
jgi:hypothetical protein